MSYVQIKYGENYIEFSSTHNFLNPVYVCFQPKTSTMWMNECDQEEIRSMQRSGVIYRKYKSPNSVIDMIMEHRPKNIDKYSLLDFQDTPFGSHIIGKYKTEKPVKK